MPMTRLRGFTLIEVLVALAILAVLGGMAWRAVNTMTETSQRVQDHTDAVWTLDAALGQWNADLDAIQEMPFATAMEWDARSLRLTRRPAAEPGGGVVVVAWTRAERAGTAQWLRWQSQPVLTRQQWTQAWTAAAQWSQSPSEALRAREIALAPISGWQLYYFRGGSWSNPLSSAGIAPGAQVPNAANTPLPDGVRLVLEVSAPHPLAGTLTRDWARPITLQGTAP